MAKRGLGDCSRIGRLLIALGEREKERERERYVYIEELQKGDDGFDFEVP